MAKESVDIIKEKIDVEKVLLMLNKALAEEWLAFYQYWVGATVVRGAMRSDVQREFQQHALEEFEHARLLAERIIQLEGTPLLHPQQWFEYASCPYDKPDCNYEVTRLLQQNVGSERCAIARYQSIAQFTNGKDFTTCDIAKRILAEEQDHEQELQDFLHDIDVQCHSTCSCE